MLISLIEFWKSVFFKDVLMSPTLSFVASDRILSRFSFDHLSVKTSEKDKDASSESSDYQISPDVVIASFLTK